MPRLSPLTCLGRPVEGGRDSVGAVARVGTTPGRGVGGLVGFLRGLRNDGGKDSSADLGMTGRRCWGAGEQGSRGDREER